LLLFLTPKRVKVYDGKTKQSKDKYCSLLWKPVSFAETKLFPTLYRNNIASMLHIESRAERSSSIAIQT